MDEFIKGFTSLINGEAVGVVVGLVVAMLGVIFVFGSPVVTIALISYRIEHGKWPWKD